MAETPTSLLTKSFLKTASHVKECASISCDCSSLHFCLLTNSFSQKKMLFFMIFTVFLEIVWSLINESTKCRMVIWFEFLQQQTGIFPQNFSSSGRLNPTGSQLSIPCSVLSNRENVLIRLIGYGSGTIHFSLGWLNWL